MSEGNAQSNFESLEDAVTRFVQVTGATRQHAQFCIEACGGNVDRALHLFYTTEDGTSGEAAHLADAPVNGGQSGPHGGPQQNLGRGNPGIMGLAAGLAGNLMRIPISILQTSFGLLGGVMSYGLGAAAIFIPLRLREAYRRTNTDMDPIHQSREFINEFENAYGNDHPQFFENGWKEAAARAHQDCKFLWVYIHSPDHEDTELFCRNVLCSADVTRYVNETFVCWGGDTRRSQAFGLSMRLGATGFPFVCLLAYSGSRLQLVSSIEGNLSPGEVLRVLRQAVEEQGALMIAERAERDQIAGIRQLREQQDREYDEAAKRDRELNEQKQREERFQQEREQARRDELRRKREEEAAEAERKLEQEAAVAQRKEDKRRDLKEEPEAGPDVATLKIRLPDGSTHNRRFYHSHTVQDIYNFVDSVENLSCLKYTLVTGFPRVFLGRDKSHLSLEMAGLQSGGTVLVQSNDDD